MARSIQRCIFINVALQQQGNRDGWGWTKGLQKRLQESMMGLGPRPRQGWNASLAGRQSSQQLGPFFQHLCQGHRVGSCSIGDRRLLCLQLMEVVPDGRAPWGSTSWAMTAESPLWPQVCQSNYRRWFYIICGYGPTYLTGSKILGLCTASNKSD